MWGISRDFEGGEREEEWEVRYLWALVLIFFGVLVLRVGRGFRPLIIADFI